jgi:hypothetical protein
MGQHHATTYPFYRSNGAIHISVHSNGISGKEWIDRFETKKYHLGSDLKSILLSPQFESTKGITSEVTIIRGTQFEDYSRFTERIQVEACNKKLAKPTLEIACLVAYELSERHLRLLKLTHVLTMHPFASVDRLLYTGKGMRGGRYLVAKKIEHHTYYDAKCGFAYVHQTQSKPITQWW